MMAVILLRSRRSPRAEGKLSNFRKKLRVRVEFIVPASATSRILQRVSEVGT